MADATPRTYIYGIIAFVFIIVAGVSLVALFSANNPSMVAGDSFSSFNSSFNKLSDATTEIGSIQSSISDSDTDFGAFGVLNALVSSAWQSLRLLASSLGFMSDAYGGMTTVFGVPAWIPGLIVLFVVVMLAFTIWSAIFQSEL
jgi:hypothetical protein